MATNGRLEALVTVPTGGWSVAVNDGVAYNASLTAGTTYSGPTALMTAFVAALNTAATGAGSLRTWTGSIASGEAGTGYATLTISAGANTTLNWTTTTLRDFLGWVANLSGAITYTSPSGVLGMFLPNCPLYQTIPTATTGMVEANITQTASPTGVTKTVYTTKRTRHPGVTWSHVTAARSWSSQEAGGVRSWQRFVEDCLIGSSGLSYFTPGGDVKFFPDAESSTATVYHPALVKSVSDVLTPAIDGFMGYGRCTWPGGWT